MSIFNDFLNGDIKKYKNSKITKSDLKKGIYALVIGCIVMFVFYLGYILIDINKKNKINKNKCETICEITDVRENRGTYVLYQYSINGILYKDRSVAPFGATIGDHYILNYQCDEISNNIIKSDEIIFTDSELKDTTSTMLLSINLKDGFFEFNFKDESNNVINKIQENNDFVLQKLINKRVRVLYLKSNPTKAILK
jgi:hypothetical protein